MTSVPVTDASPRTVCALAQMMARQAELMSDEGEGELARALRGRARALRQLADCGLDVPAA